MPVVHALSAAERALRLEVSENVSDYIRFALATLAKIDASAQVTKWNPDSRNIERLEKAAVAPGTTTDPQWAAPLVGMDVLVSAFGELLRPAEVLGRLLPKARRVPFNVTIPRRTAGASAGWVGEGKPAPFSSLAFDDDTFGFSKVMALVAITKDLVKEGRPDAVALVSKDLTKASAGAVDQALLDPTWAGMPGVSPPAVTHGAPTVAASGTDAAAFRKDAAALVSAMVAADTGLASPAWVMSPPQRAALSLMDAALIRDDGTLAGWPILETTSPAVAGRIVLIDASELNIADGGAELDSTEAALLEMAAPATNPPTAATVMVSTWVENLVCLRVLRYVNWMRTRPGSAGYISGAAYGLV